MPSKRHARRQHRDADRAAAAGDRHRAHAGMLRAAAAYRAHLDHHPGDRDTRRALTDLLADLAASRATDNDHAGTAAALTERLDHLTELDAPATDRATTGLDLAEAHLAAGHLLSAATTADDAVRTYDRHGATDPTTPAFTDLATALARNARLLHRTADPDLAVGAADQATRMLLAAPDPTAHTTDLRHSLTLAAALHTAAARTHHAHTATATLHRHFGPTPPPRPAPGPPLTLRSALTTAAELGCYRDRPLIDRLCPDPAARTAPPAISARCDPALATVALHATARTVTALHTTHTPLAWRIATEIHYLLTAADHQGERNLRLNLRDHGPTWMTTLLALARTVGPRRHLAADLARIMADLLTRLRSRHAVESAADTAARRFIEQHTAGPNR